jgi:hypothetical protein
MNQWGPWTGWTRVSRGSHAGHIPLRGDHSYWPSSPTPANYVPAYPGRDVRERTTTAAGLRLVPLETLRERYRPLPAGIGAPQGKEVYRDPVSDNS